MPQDATCPKCTHLFPVTEARQAFTVACPKCDAAMTVEFKKPATPPEAGQAPYDLLVRKGALPGATAPPPLPKKKPADDDEPVRKGGSAMIVLLSGGMGLLFVVGGLALTGWLLFTQIDMTETVTNRPNNNNKSNPGNRGNSNPGITPGNPGFNPGGNPGVNPGFNPGGNPGFNPGGNPGVNPVPKPKPQPKPKPKDTFDLRPVAGKLDPIREPANLQPNAPKTIQLPGPAGAVAVGGGGRYVVFHSPEQGRLSVFDANTAELTHSVAAEAEGVLLAAGANKVVTLAKKRMQVYALPDLRAEKEFDQPMFHSPIGIAMGAATNGPVLVADPFGKVALMDLATGEAVDGATRDAGGFRATYAHASHDGARFLVGNGYRGSDRHQLLDESGGKWRVRDPNVEAGYLSADGQHLYARNAIKTVGGNLVASKPSGVADHCWYVPAATATGNYFMRVSEAKIPNRPNQQAGLVTFHKDNDVDKAVAPQLLALPEIEGLVSQIFGASEPLDRHLILIPEAKLLVVLTRARDRLVVRKLPI